MFDSPYWERIVDWSEGNDMPRQDARQSPSSLKEHQSATLERDRLSRVNQARFDAARKEPVYALYARFRDEQDFATDMAPVYLLAVSGSRVRLLVQSRNGRYIHTWQPRRRLGDFSLVKVTPDQTIYGFLAVYLGARNRRPTTAYSEQLAAKFAQQLGEMWIQEPMRGYGEAV